MSKILVVLCAVLMLTLAPSVKADPLVVTSGSLTVTGIMGGPSFNLSGDNFSMSGGGNLGSTQAQQCFPCVSGNQISVNAFFAGPNLAAGNMTFEGTPFTNLRFGGTFQFFGTALIPAATTNITITTPFTFVGDVRACDFNGAPDCTPANSIFSTQLVGQGIATIQLDFLFINASGKSVYGFNTITYNFQSAEVPEPMTITLLAAGLMGLGAKWKLAKKRRH